MAHKSEKGTWSKTASTGCMWGLISMFNFRRFTSRRFLVSQSRRNGRHSSGKWYSRRRLKLLTNSEGKSEQIAALGADNQKNGNLMTESVKNLMNKEMSSSKQSQGISIAERCQINDESRECPEKSQSTSDKDLEVNETRNMNDSSAHRNMGPYQSLFLEITARISNSFDVTVLVNDMERGKRNHHYVNQVTEKDNDAYLSVERENYDVLPFLDQINGDALLGLSIQEMIYKTLESDLRGKFPGAVRNSLKDECSTSEDLGHSLEMSSVYKDLFLDSVVRVLQNSTNIHWDSSNIKHLENDIDNSKPGINICYPNQNEKVEKNGMNGFPHRQSSIMSKSQPSSRIVILKPNPKKTKSASVSDATGKVSQAYSSGLRLKEENGTTKSHLFLHDVKRRLAHLFGDKHIPQDVKIADLSSSRRSRQASNTVIKNNASENQKTVSSNIGYEADSVENHRCSNDATLMTTSSSSRIQSGFLSASRVKELGDSSANSEKKGSSSLQKLLSLPTDYITDFRYSSEKDTMASFSPQHMRSRSWNSEQETDLKFIRQPSSTADGAVQMMNYNTDSSATGTEEISSEGDSPVEGVRKCRADESLILEKGRVVKGGVDQETENRNSASLHDSFASPPLDPLKEISQPHYPSSTAMLDALLINSPDVNESVGDKQERPSPVSVLETSVIDNIGRAESTFTINESYPKFRVVPRHIYFEDSDDSEGFLPKSSQSHLSTCMEDEEFKYGYVKSLLEAAGLSSYLLLNKSQLPHPLLDPSLYDEVETPSEEIPDDLKLFFDCVADVLEEIYERSSSSKPWVLFAKPELRIFPVGEKLIEEVVRELDSLYVLLSPKTFEDIVRRELENGPWMDIREAVEDFGLEVGQAILDKLLEEIVLELCD